MRRKPPITCMAFRRRRCEGQNSPRVLRAAAFASSPPPVSLRLRPAKPPHSCRPGCELVPQPESRCAPLTRPFAPANRRKRYEFESCHRARSSVPFSRLDPRRIWSLSVSRVCLALPVGVGLGIQRRVAPEIPQSTARQGRHRHFHSATLTTTTADHHPRIRFLG